MHGKVAMSTDKVCLLPASFLPALCPMIAGTSMSPQQFSGNIIYTAAVLCNNSTTQCATAAVCSTVGL